MSGVAGESTRAEQKTRVFLSYSRKDRTFAENLRDHMVRDGYDAYLDIHDIVKGEPWQERLQSLIFGADVVLFLISPDSVSSEICDWEVNEAERLGKRILPVVCRAVTDNAVPGRLKRLNYAFLDDEEKWTSEYPALCRELNRDIALVREHTRISERAAVWDRHGRPRDEKLLSPDELRDARAWEARRPDNVALSAVCIAFLDASEAKSAEDRERLLTITGRAFVKPAEQAFANSHHDVALRLAAAGIVLGEDEDCVLVPERAESLRAALWESRLRVTFKGHSEELCALRLSPRGDLVATASNDGALFVWHYKTGAVVMEKRLDEWIGAIAFSPDGAWVTAANGDGRLFIWDIATAQEVAALPGRHFVIFSRDGRRIASSDGASGACIWDTSSFAKVSALSGHVGLVSSGHFSSCGTKIVTGGAQDRRAHLWDVETGRLLKQYSGFETGIHSVVLSRDGRSVLAASDGDGAIIWNTESGRIILRREGQFGEVSAGNFSQDCSQVLIVARDGATLHDAQTGAAVHLSGPFEIATGSFYPTDDRIVSALPGEVLLWSSDFRDAERIAASISPIRHATVSPDATRIITSSADGLVKVWDAARGLEYASWKASQSGVVAVGYTDDPESVVTCSEDGIISCWRATGELVATKSIPVDLLKGRNWPLGGAQFIDNAKRLVLRAAGRSTIWDVSQERALVSLDAACTAADRDFRFLASASSGELTITDFESGAVCSSEEDALMFPLSACFHPGGGTIAVGDQDGEVKIFDVSDLNSHRAIRTGEGLIYAVEYSADGALLAVIDDKGRLTIFNVASWEVVAPSHDVGDAKRLWFHPSLPGLLVALGSTSTIFDAVSGQLIGAIQHDCGVTSAMSPDGRSLATVDRDGSVRLLDVSRVLALCGPPATVLAASLTNGRGRKTKHERADLLMQAAPDDVYEALLARLTPRQREDVMRRAEVLARPLHPKCYSPRAHHAAMRHRRN